MVGKRRTRLAGAFFQSAGTSLWARLHVWDLSKAARRQGLCGQTPGSPLRRLWAAWLDSLL